MPKPNKNIKALALLTEISNHQMSGLISPCTVTAAPIFTLEAVQRETLGEHAEQE